MKRILTTTALVALMSGPALAETHSMESPFRDSVMENEIRASEFIGSRVYVTEAELQDDMEPMNEASKDWEDIGEINDVLMNRDGSVQAILVDVGGFLGMGEKQVAVNMDELKLVSDGDDADDYFIVFTGNKAAIEEAPEFTFEEDAMKEDKVNASAETETETEIEQDTAEVEVESETEMEQDTEQAAAELEQESEQAAAEIETETEQAAAEVEQETEEATAEVKQETDEATTELAQEADQAETEAQTEMAENDIMAPRIERDGYEGVKIADMTSEELTGAPVYDANDEWVGEVSELIVSEDGKITNAIVDVGGFLGIGEKPVSMDFQELSIQKEVDGDDLRIYVGATEEELESMPEWDEK
ncbi:PRC-barrel domain-containing protein [Stappia sp.]|uniref:PRC-barrel domain-containing protein n=1 Tax=Stappia sp. TaxID=1870903 RepID=UPI003A98F095